MSELDARIPLSSEVRDELRAMKKGTETYDELIRRLLLSSESGSDSEGDLLFEIGGELEFGAVELQDGNVKSAGEHFQRAAQEFYELSDEEVSDE